MVGNKIDALRVMQERKKTLGNEEKAYLQQGFATPFWSILRKELITSLDSCRDELESVTSDVRMHQLQGEIAALRVLLDWAAAVTKESKPPFMPTNL